MPSRYAMRSQQNLKPQRRLRFRIGCAQKLCEDAGKLGMPQATEEFAEAKLKYAQMLCVHANKENWKQLFKPQTKLRGWVDFALLLCESSSELCCEINNKPSSHRRG